VTLAQKNKEKDVNNNRTDLVKIHRNLSW